MFFKAKVFFSESEDVFSEGFFPKYFGLFVKPEGFISFFFAKLDFPLKPKDFFSPFLKGLSDLSLLKDLGLSLKLDFPLKPKGFFSPSLEDLSDLSLLKDLGLSLKLEVRSRLTFP